MDSIKQYTDLYRQNPEAFAAGADALDALKADALEALDGFAAAKAPKAPYKECSDEALLAPDYGLNLTRLTFAVDLAAAFRCDVPNISTLLGVTVNDIFRPTETLLRQLPEGVAVCSLAEAARTRPALVEPFLNKLAGNSSPAAALNTLLLQDGVLVHISAGVHLDRPVQLVNIFNSDVPLLAARRLLVVADEGASARILVCDHTQNHATDYLSDEVIEIFQAPDSKLELYFIEESGERTNRIGNVFARQESGSSLTVSSTVLGGGVDTTHWHVDVTGDGAETHIGGLVVADGRQIVDNTVHLRHSSRNSSSRQLFKYALFGEARGAFGGKIIVDEGATGTDAAQTNRNLLASDDSRMSTAPQLEIYCDDVKCSHGATTGQLDANALFYMRSRGIPLQEARLMLTQAFMTDVIDGISYELIRDRLRHLVEKRLSGERASCASCGIEKSCNR